MSSTCRKLQQQDKKQNKTKTFKLKKKGTRLLFWIVVWPLVAQAASRRCSLCVIRPWKGCDQREAGAPLSARVARLFSSLHATITAGHGVKGTTVTKHAGIHGLWVTLRTCEGRLVGGVARVHWQLLWLLIVTHLKKGELVLVTPVWDVNHLLHFNSSLYRHEWLLWAEKVPLLFISALKMIKNKFLAWL